MTSHRYPTLLVAALAAAFFGAAVAQTQSDDTSRMPARKGTAQESQTQPSADQTDKMKGDQGQMMKSDQSAQTAKSPADSSAMSDHKAENAKHAGDHASMADQNAGKNAGEPMAMSDHKAKTAMKHGAHKGKAEDAASSDDKAYRDALRDCVKQQDPSQRDSCLDNAIAKFQRNA